LILYSVTNHKGNEPIPASASTSAPFTPLSTPRKNRDSPTLVKPILRQTRHYIFLKSPTPTNEINDSLHARPLELSKVGQSPGPLDLLAFGKAA
jgi:hypothetical protein